MEVNDRERAVLINNLCLRLGKWANEQVYQPFSNSTINSIREDAERLVELLDARELSLYRKQYDGPKRDYKEEG